MVFNELPARAVGNVYGTDQESRTIRTITPAAVLPLQVRLQDSADRGVWGRLSWLAVACQT